MSRTTIYAGLAELESSAPTTQDMRGPKPRVRAVGGGPKRLTDKDAGLLDALDALEVARTIEDSIGRR